MQDKILPQIPKRMELGYEYYNAVMNIVKANPKEFGLTPNQISNGPFQIALPIAVTMPMATPPARMIIGRGRV